MPKKRNHEKDAEEAFGNLAVCFFRMAEDKSDPDAFMTAYEACSAAAAVLRAQAYDYLKMADMKAEKEAMQ